MPSEFVDSYWKVINHMEIWLIQQNKEGFLPKCLHITMGTYLMETNKTNREKDRRELHTNVARSLKQI